MKDYYLPTYKIYVQFAGSKRPVKTNVTKVPIKGEATGVVLGSGRAKRIVYMKCTSIDLTIDDKDKIYNLSIDIGDSFNTDTGRGF